MDYGISIEKRTLFRGFQQPFSNVYYYREPGVVQQSEAVLESLLQFLVAREKELHSIPVTFSHGRVWRTNSGSQENNVMIVNHALSGAGSAGENGALDRERAILVQWPAGLSVTNKPVKLRKWYHTCADPPGLVFTQAMLNNTGFLTDAIRNAYLPILNQLRNITLSGTTFDLMAKSGRMPTGGATVHRALEHHQLGDQWR